MLLIIILTILFKGFVLLLRICALFAAAILVISDLFGPFLGKNKVIQRLAKRPLTNSHYVGVVLLVGFGIWPLISELSVAGVSVKRLEERITQVESSIDDLYSRKKIERWFYDDFKKLNVTTTTKDVFYHYEIPLRDKPIKNSVTLWLGRDLQNPLYYTVHENERKIDLRIQLPPQELQGLIEHEKPSLTVEYVIKK